MKSYELKSEEELAAQYQRQQRDRNNFDLGDTVPRLLEFFASGVLVKGGMGERRTAEGDRGKERAGCQGEGNGPRS